MLTVALGFAAGYRLGTPTGHDVKHDSVTAYRIPRHAEVGVSTRVYQVHDILANSANDQHDLSVIVSHIQRAIEPGSWSAPDRVLLAYSRQRSIVVKQTEEVHLQISSFLSSLRNQRAITREVSFWVDRSV
jgi:hypothetical protein